MGPWQLELGPMPGIGPGSSCQEPMKHWSRFGWGHSSRFVARTGTKAIAEDLVPVRGMNRDECPSPPYISNPRLLLYSVIFFARIGGKWVLVFFSFATHKMCSMKCPSHT